MISFSAFCGICVILGIYDAIIWSSNESLEIWHNYEIVRSSLSDWPVPEYSQVYKELEHLGITENDWWMVTHWTTADPSVFSLETMQAMAQIQQQHQPSLGMKVALTSYLSHIAHTPTLWIFVCGTVAYSMLKGPCRIRCSVLILILLSFIINLYFFKMGRLPERVEYPVWACSIVLCFILNAGQVNCSKPADPKPSQFDIFTKSIATLLLIAPISCLAISCALGTTPKAFSEVFCANSNPESNVVVEYSDENPEKVLWWDTATMADYRAAFDSIAIPPLYYLEHNFKLGGWTTNSPQTDWTKTNAGVESGIISLLQQEETLYVTTPENPIVEHLTQFLLEHYDIAANPSIEYTLLGENGKAYQLWRFHTSA